MKLDFKQELERLSLLYQVTLPREGAFESQGDQSILSAFGKNTKYFSPLFEERGKKQSPQDPLLRAIGKKESVVVDLTLGLGRDFLKMLLAGHMLWGVERNAFVWEFTRQAIELIQGPLKNTELIWGDAVFFIQNDFFHLYHSKSFAPLRIRPLVFYFDPMFEDDHSHHHKTLPKKNMQILRLMHERDDSKNKSNNCLHLTEVTSDISALIKTSFSPCKLIIKRGNKMTPLISNHRQTTVIKTKLLRYDVYQF